MDQVASGNSGRWKLVCVVVASAQGEHIVRSLKHVDFFLRSPPGHPTSKHARNRLPTDEQSLLILERVKVVGFGCFGWRQTGRRQEGGEGPGTEIPSADPTHDIGIGEPWKILRQGPEPSVPANCPVRNLHSRHITTHEQRRAVEESQQKLPLGNGLHHPRTKTSLR